MHTSANAFWRSKLILTGNTGPATLTAAIFGVAKVNARTMLAAIKATFQLENVAAHGVFTVVSVITGLAVAIHKRAHVDTDSINALHGTGTGRNLLLTEYTSITRQAAAVLELSVVHATPINAV